MKAYAKKLKSDEYVEYEIDEEAYNCLPCGVYVNNDPIGYLRLSSGEMLHRWILGLETGDPNIGDHINKNIYDNRASNLRIVTPTESNYNRKPWNKAGLPAGVKRSTRGDRFAAWLGYAGVKFYLGLHDTVEEAVAARERKLEEILGAVEKRVSP